MVSKKWKVLWDKRALEDLLLITKKDAQLIVKKVENYLSKDPLKLGKPLKGQLKNLYRYRVGNYRVVYAIEKEEITILVVRIGKRDEIYKK
ncbi:MAG: mRNA interferase RelE/StbE [Candidatus Atribacteria bacterium]|nr:mRNA interferase RelE/StbE [Candidatus Atribacteria bacterium]